MRYLNKPFQLGKLTLPSNIFCAPLAGCSDLPFRRMTKKYQPGLIYCEMVKMDALVRHDPNTYHLLDFEKEMHPIGAQLCGSKANFAGPAAKIVEDLGFDVVDLNCGCPVDKVTKDGSGSGLLKTPFLIGELVSNMVAAVKIPVTVKIRAGWDEQHINGAEITRIAESAGAAAICIHGRTRAQGYKGPANWKWIRECREAAKNILVIGNGDLFAAEDASRMFEETGCDALLLSRGTMGQPWLIEDIYRHLEGEPSLQRTAEDYRTELLQHLNHVVSYHPDRKAAMEMRRIGCWYLKRGRGARKLREKINQSRTIAETRQHILDFTWDEIDFSEEEIVESAAACD